MEKSMKKIFCSKLIVSCKVLKLPETLDLSLISAIPCLTSPVPKIKKWQITWIFPVLVLMAHIYVGYGESSIKGNALLSTYLSYSERGADQSVPPKSEVLPGHHNLDVIQVHHKIMYLLLNLFLSYLFIQFINIQLCKFNIIFSNISDIIQVSHFPPSRHWGCSVSEDPSWQLPGCQTSG